MGSCEEGYKKTEDPKFVEDFLTSPDHISFSLLLLLLLLLTYLLTPWSIVLLEKLTGSAASQEIPAICGNTKFITVFTTARHLSPS